MSLPFSEEHRSRGTFEDDVLELVKKAFTTETFHYRVIVSLEDPFNGPVDVVVVKNQLGAYMALEGIIDAEDAITEFKSEFVYGWSGETDPINIFCTLMLMQNPPNEESEFKNTDHPEIRWCIDPRLVSQAFTEVCGKWYFMVPLETTIVDKDIGKDRSQDFIILAKHENDNLDELEGIDELTIPSRDRCVVDRLIKEKSISPSICLVAEYTTDRYVKDFFPRIRVLVEMVENAGFFPVLYGVKVAEKEDDADFCCIHNINPFPATSYGDLNRTPGFLLKANPDGAEKALVTTGMRWLSRDEHSVVTWEKLSKAMKSGSKKRRS